MRVNHLWLSHWYLSPTILQCVDTHNHPPQISGWNFDNLTITIQQRLCEAFYIANRAKEASNGILEIVGALREEACVSGPTTEWLIGELMVYPFLIVR